MIKQQMQEDNHSETEYFKNIVKIDNSNYINFLLANFCMPTLLQLKASTLVQIQKKHGSLEEALNILWLKIRQYNCKYIILYENHMRASVLIYHESTLRNCLLKNENQDYLIGLGYQLYGDRLTQLFFTLSKRINNYNKNKSEGQFPHEIGIILGYPLRDVKEFVSNKGQNYIACGCWKVYHNPEHSKKMFELYHKIRVYSVNCVKEGKSLPRDFLCIQ